MDDKKAVQQKLRELSFLFEALAELGNAQQESYWPAASQLLTLLVNGVRRRIIDEGSYQRFRDAGDPRADAMQERMTNPESHFFQSDDGSDELQPADHSGNDGSVQQQGEMPNKKSNPHCCNRCKKEK